MFRNSGKAEYEQLFDLKTDPWETINLARDKNYTSDLQKMRLVLGKWEQETETTKPVASQGKAVEE